MGNIFDDSALCIKPYNTDFKYGLTSLRKDNYFIMDSLIDYLCKNPQYGAVYVAEDKVKRVLVIEPDGYYANISVFVGRDYRDSRIGSALLNKALSVASNINVTTAICSFEQKDGDVRDFLIHRNFNFWGSSFFMEQRYKIHIKGYTS